jgi:hypothetical protein
MAPQSALSTTTLATRDAIISAYRQKDSILTPEGYRLADGFGRRYAHQTLEELLALERRLTRLLDGADSVPVMSPFSPTTPIEQLSSTPPPLSLASRRRRGRSDSPDDSSCRSNRKRQRTASAQPQHPLAHRPDAAATPEIRQRVRQLIPRVKDKTVTYEELVEGYACSVYKVWDPAIWDNEGWIRTFSASIDTASAIPDRWVSAALNTFAILMTCVGPPS